MNIIDRRPNPKNKSLANRQRFLRRVREHVKRAVDGEVSGRKVTDILNGGKISVGAKGVEEPVFQHGKGGNHDFVVPGNKDYVTGDAIPRPEEGGGKGSQGSRDGDGMDEFRFTISQEEFLNIFFEDMELPDLTKTKLKESESYETHRAGYSPTGSPANLNLVRTMRNSLSRRIALNRPKPDEVAALEAKLAEAEAIGDEDAIALLRDELAALSLRMKRVPFIDPIDVRFNRFEKTPRPASKAVMFCLMDVSGSMTEYRKDIAKRFFMLLYLFLQRRYKKVDVVFIRHTHEAQEVDEQTFFYDPQTGGTMVSTALEEMQKVIQARYPADDWNIYAAQASDGENASGDGEDCEKLLEMILPLVQYFAFIQVRDGTNAAFYADEDLWQVYDDLSKRYANLAMRRVTAKGEIWGVFSDLFHKNKNKAA